MNAKLTLKTYVKKGSKWACVGKVKKLIRGSKKVKNSLMFISGDLKSVDFDLLLK